MNKKEIINCSKEAKRVEKDDVIIAICSGKNVLDVGCIGQDRDFTSDNWLHNKVRKIAAQVDGVDILIDQVNELKLKGYSMFSVDELKKSTRTYDVILMADVIEHVNDPVDFLNFYSKFLSPSGKIFISTPNSNRSTNFINILFNNNYSVNPEHTFWFCPRTFSEVVNRAKLTIQDFFWANHYFKSSQVKGFYQQFKFMLANLLLSWRSNFSPNMIFILSKNFSNGPGETESNV